MLESGIDPNIIVHIPLLHWIIQQKWIRGLKILLTYKVSVNQSFRNETALDYAIKEKSVVMVNILLTSGARAIHMQSHTDIILAHETTPATVLSNLLVYNHLIWRQFLPFEAKQALQSYVYYNIKDQYACYTALYEGEDHVLKKYRQGECVVFSQSTLRGIVRPMTNWNVRKSIMSYLIHPTKTRHLLYSL